MKEHRGVAVEFHHDVREGEALRCIARIVGSAYGLEFHVSRVREAGGYDELERQPRPDAPLLVSILDRWHSTPWLDVVERGACLPIVPFAAFEDRLRSAGVV